jgi:hypothetical protein
MTRNESINDWVFRLSACELPVLKRTVRDLAVLHDDGQALSCEAIAQIIERDPLMTIKLLRELKPSHSVTLVELVRLLPNPQSFFEYSTAHPLIEDLIKRQTAALPQVLRLLHRAHRASAYAYDWSVRLHDWRCEDVRIATQLYDIAKILMWYFAPEDMLKIRALQQQDKSLTNQDIQHQVLGFELFELQKELILQWGLAQSLQTLMNDTGTDTLRTRTISLAINLARHSAKSEDNTSLPDDYQALARLLHLPLEQTIAIVNQLDSKEI